MKALVTGGAGFIGSHLVEMLIEDGHEVVAIDNLHCGQIKNFNTIKNNPNFSFHQVDIRDYDKLFPHFENVDWVFHLAALADIVPSIEMPKEYFQTNVDGTFNVLECAKTTNVKRFIYAASSSCYGIPDVYPTPETHPPSPQYPYALTKYLGEQLVMHWEQLYQLPSISLRLFNVYGPRARTSGTYGAVFGVFLTQKIHNQPYTVVGDGSQTRDFTYVTDVAQAFLCSAKSDISGEIFNVGSSGHYSVNKLVKLLQGEVTFIPKRPGEPDSTFADISKIQKMLNFSATISFEEGVSKLLQHIDDYQDAPLWNPASIEKATESWFHHLTEREPV